MQKRAIKYNRFSHDGQSNYSIERQDMINDSWMKYHNIQLVDSFNDEGYTARTFDRPDIKKLFEFIRKNHSRIDYLVVSDLVRFSRDAPDAIKVVQKIQEEYSIKIVSASRGNIYDCTDHNSFFMMGLEFLLGNQENIKRQQDINGGIYAAKAIKGRWIQGGPAPYGFKKEGIGKDRHLVVDEEQAAVVQFIYQSYLRSTPIYIIEQEAKQMGFTKKSNTAILEILRNPLYNGRQQVKAYKEQPGGLFPVNVDAIIDTMTWHNVQDKLNAKNKPRISIADEVPLRGVLHSECGRLLTAAPSRNKMGNYYYYYKCNHCRQNLSANNLHKQLSEAFNYMSLPASIIDALKERHEKVFESKMQENIKSAMQKRREISQAKTQLESVETKWINNQLAHDSYSRWHDKLTQRIGYLNAEIKKLDRSKEQISLLISNTIEKLTDLGQLYSKYSTLNKQEFIRKVFDNRLYHKNGTYRTPYLMPAFTHNLLILKQKRLLELDLMNETSRDVEATGLLSNTFLDFLSFIDSIRVA